VEASALTRESSSALRGPSPLLRLQSDERLIAMTRRGQHAAFEVLFARYQSRLLAFCRHMLTSREDAEDVLQEVFAAAFNAVLADDRAINVRPWLYRIARNRSLNHLRRASAIGVDSMDVHYADNGLSTGERVLRRESFRLLLGDVKGLPETQRTALLLREIDALSYEQIAAAMETTVPSVKSLLVRARISLAEAAEARELSCAQVREQLGEMAEGLTKLSAPARRHVRGCQRCQAFKRHLRANNHALAAIFPVGTLLLAKKLLLTKLGSTASAGHVGASATAGAGAGVTVGAGAGGASVSGGLLTAGASAVATKAAAGLAAAAIVTAGAVAAEHSSTPAHRHRAPVASASVATVHQGEPIVVHTAIQPVTSERTIASAALRSHRGRRTRTAGDSEAGAAQAQQQASETAVGGTQPVKATNPPVATQVVEVTTDMTQLPPSATGAPRSQPSVVAAPATPVTDLTGGTLSPPAESGPPAPTTPGEVPAAAPASSTATGSDQTSPPIAAGGSSPQLDGPAEQTTETDATESTSTQATGVEPAAEGDTTEASSTEPTEEATDTEPVAEVGATGPTAETGAAESTGEAAATEPSAGEPGAAEAASTEAGPTE
jgi:RNA polymerase sigma factor (sigma-70 family)